MFTLDTEILTPNGLIEAWKLFPGDELLDRENEAHVIEDVSIEKELTHLVTLEDETEFLLADSFLERIDLKVNDDLILGNPISLTELESVRPDYQPVLLIDGMEFGNYGKYESIPFYYTMNTIKNRKSFLQGLFFSQLVVANNDMNEVIMLVSNNEFAEDILYLVRSLGGTGYYYMFYSGQEYFEVTINLPKYFNEGVPSRKVVKISEDIERDLLYFETKQKSFIIKDFITILNKGENNE